MNEPRRRLLLGLITAFPGVAATIAVAAFSGLELLGRTPSSPGPVRNISEAVASGRAPDVMRLLTAGQDPNRVWPVRRDVISSAMTQVTAFEAAIVTGRTPMLDLLHRQGASTDAQTLEHLQCLASDLSAQEIVESLSSDRKPDCVYGAAIERVLERARRSRGLQ
jgi:hypothetical protein